MSIEAQILQALAHPENDLSDYLRAHVAGLLTQNPAFAETATHQEEVVMAMGGTEIPLTVAPEEQAEVAEEPEAGLSGILVRNAQESPETAERWAEAFVGEISPRFRTADKVGYNGLGVHEPMSIAEQLRLSEILEALEAACRLSQEQAERLF